MGKFTKWNEKIIKNSTNYLRAYMWNYTCIRKTQGTRVQNKVLLYPRWAQVYMAKTIKLK